MKTLKIFLISMFITVPALTFAQSQDSKGTSKKSERAYQKKSSRMKTSTDSSDVTAILKDSTNAESGPILNDNGNVSTNGTIDGRSSTGRPDADTTGSYTVKRKKKTIRTGGSIMPDTTKRRSRP
ncbi:hypothetical protein [Dyadobacter sp. CY326]|uniref:hypothetical protein n=1 Tax=Dyadobacter sp. CY326 TaxID=2907300 RepID=UPI001F2626B1|nr:hypothetical protein [Dyadobacter sp. CY326]MCE7066096.1 hypothetical protein [Dyadobacter sp. CY326]